MTPKISTPNDHRVIASKAGYGIRPRQKQEPVEYQGILPELWLHTFSFLQAEGDKASLASLALASKSFAALAQPLIFQHIIIRPECGKHPHSGRLTYRKGRWEWITERIQFCTRDRIAHAVVTIEFTPTINYARRERNSTEVAVVADIVIRTLPLFPRLRSFRCAHLVLYPHHLYTISGMPNLRSLHTTNCHLSDHFHDYTQDPMEEFTVSWQGDTADVLGVTLPPHSHQRWFSFIHPDHLRALNLVPLDDFLDQMLTDLVGRDLQFHALRSLGLPWTAVECKSFVPLLERVPFLRELRFTVRSSHRKVLMEHPLPRHVLRNLSVLEAPDNSLQFLLENEGLRELTCVSMYDSGSLPTDIVTTFDALSPEILWKIEKLSLDMKCISELLDCLIRRGSRITTLNLEVRGTGWGPRPGSLELHTTEVQWIDLTRPRAD